MEILQTKLNGFTFFGFKDEYIFETVNKTNNFYEIKLLEKWKYFVPDNSIILDIGSNIGNHMLYWSKNAKNIYAFEPENSNYELLCKNIESNNLEKITAVKKCVGKEKSFAKVSSIDKSNMGSTTFEYADDGISVIDIDSFVTENNIETIDFVKIDTEGFEVDVLKGSLKILEKFKPNIWIEVRTDTLEEVRKILTNLGYDLVDIDTFNFLFIQKDKLKDIKKITSDEILQSNMQNLEGKNNYYANYLKAKEWHKSSQEKVSLLTEQNAKINEWHKSSQEKIAIQNEKIASQNEKIAIQNETIKQKNQKIGDLEKFVREYYDETNKQIETLQELSTYIRKLEAKNGYLLHENTVYKRKITRITNTWYGKILIKTYRVLIKIRRKFKR